MLRDYIEYYPEDEDCIRNFLFKKIAKALTSYGQRTRNIVNYASGRLLCDNFDLIQCILDTTDQDKIMLVNTLEAFLKSTFEAHIMICSVIKREFAFVVNNSMIYQCDICDIYL